MSDWASILRPAARRILEALIEGPLSLTALAQRTGTAKGSLSPHLRSLAEIGVVERREVRTETGREVYFHLRDAGLHLEIHADAKAVVSWATSGEQEDGLPFVNQVADARVRQEVRLAVEEILDACESDFSRQLCVVLFGSAARGETTWKSDIDLLLLASSDWSKDEREQIELAIANVQSELDHAVRAQFSTVGTFLEGKRAIEREAARDGVVVFDSGGDKRVWGRLARYKRISI